MNITKAILLTILLVVIFYIPQGILVLLYKKTDLFGDGIKDHFYSVVTLAYLIAYLVVLYFFWKPKPILKSVFDFNQLDLKLVPYLLLIVVGLEFAEQPFVDFHKIINYYKTSEIKPYSNNFTGINGFFIYYSISSLLIAPIFEELFFRKFLFAKLLEKNHLWTSILVSSLCFAAIHFETPSNLIPTLVFGIIACLVYFKTKNIVYTIVIHFFNNLISTLYSVYGESFFKWVYGLEFGFIYWALFAFGILTTILSVKKITMDNRELN